MTTPSLPDVYLWVCLNCGNPEVIEDGGFFPEKDYVRNGGHPANYTIECGLCCHDEFVKIQYGPIWFAEDLWERRRINLV